MKKQELLKILEVHQGNEWRAFTMFIDRLPISDEQKEELIDSALCYGEAIVAYYQTKIKGQKK